jgi:hypothetical protein
VEALRELAVDAVAEHAERGVKVNGERDLGGERVLTGSGEERNRN